MTASSTRGRNSRMREVVDQLIEERAPWMRRGGLGVRATRAVLYRLLRYETTVRILSLIHI